MLQIQLVRYAKHQKVIGEILRSQPVLLNQLLYFTTVPPRFVTVVQLCVELTSQLNTKSYNICKSKVGHLFTFYRFLTQFHCASSPNRVIYFARKLYNEAVI